MHCLYNDALHVYVLRNEEKLTDKVDWEKYSQVLRSTSVNS